MTWTPPKTIQLISTNKEPKPDENYSPQGGPISAWSESALQGYESCPYKMFLKRVKRIPEPAGEAADRGSYIHELAEKYVMAEIGELPKELIKFEERFKNMREKYAEGRVIVEEDWGFNIDWEPTGWMAKDIWARIKLDLFVQEDETSGKVIDHKTGKKFGNEIKHNRQAMTYAIGAFMRFPELEFVTTEFWYLDHGEVLRNHYTRKQLPIIKPRLEARALKLTSATEFPPTPSTSACKWCHYRKSGDCEWGVE